MKLTFNGRTFVLNDRGSDCRQGNNTMRQETVYASDKSETVVRNVINGKLYDTSKATKICTMCIPKQEIPLELHPTGILGCLDEYRADLYVGKRRSSAYFANECLWFQVNGLKNGLAYAMQISTSKCLKSRNWHKI